MSLKLDAVSTEVLVSLNNRAEVLPPGPLRLGRLLRRPSVWSSLGLGNQSGTNEDVAHNEVFAMGRFA